MSLVHISAASVPGSGAAGRALILPEVAAGGAPERWCRAEALLRAAAAACLRALGLSFWSFWWPVLGGLGGLNLHCHGE